MHARVRLLLLVAALGVAARSCQASNLLLMTRGPTKSHKLLFSVLAEGLAERGHNVTLISPFPSDKVIPNLEDISPMGLVQMIAKFNDVDLVGARIKNSEPVSWFDALRLSYASCEALLNDSETQAFLSNDSSRQYDLVVFDGSLPDCDLGFVHHFRAPFVVLNTVTYYMESLVAAGNPAPYSISGFFILPLTDNMNIWERISNAAHSTLAAFLRPVVAYLTHRFLLTNQWPDMPSPKDMLRNSSFGLHFGHSSVSYLRPFLPNVAEIGCIHCKPAKPLPKHLEDFVSGNGEEGFIYISLGSSVKATNMPESLRQLFVKVFAQLPYRVLWKWENGNGSMADVSSNVYLGRWLPQQDILGHRLIRAFITQGGLLSVFETLYHAVPAVVMPVYCDQNANAIKAANDGYAVNLELRDMTADSLLAAIQAVIHDPSYRANVQKRSLILRDEPETPLSRALFWVEYVIRTKGAYHLQSEAKDMSVMTYYSFDLAALGLLALALAVVVIRRSWRPVWNGVNYVARSTLLMPELIKQHLKVH